jgi:site-specific DNA recombinase
MSYIVKKTPGSLVATLGRVVGAALLCVAAGNAADVGAYARHSVDGRKLTRALTNVTEQKSAVTTANITERDISEAFQNIEEFWDVLYPAERNRLIRLIVEKIEVRETGIDMEVRTGGLATLITELAGLTVEIKERKS